MAIQVSLVTSDKQVFTVDKAVALHSAFIGGVIDNPSGPSGEPIQLPQVTANVLKKVLEYCDHHQTRPLPNGNDDKPLGHTTEIGEWDQKFLSVDQEMPFDIILAAHYLDIKPLVDIGCQTITNMIKGKSPEEIRKQFNIVNDFTPEEEAQIKKENEWAEDR